MISNIKKQFINRLKAAEWIDEGTKETGVNKVKRIVEIIAEHSLNFDEDIVKGFLKLSDVCDINDGNIIILSNRTLLSFSARIHLQ